MIDQTSDVVKTIQKRLQLAQTRQKSYVDTKGRPLDFEAGDHVFLNVSPLKGSLRFRKKGKLSPRFIESLEILQKV